MTYRQARNLLLENYNRLHRRSADHPFNPECAYCGNGHLHPNCNGGGLTSVNCCIKDFTRQKAQPDWPGQQQQETLQRWNEWCVTVDPSLREAAFDLSLISKLLADYFFCGPWNALTHRVDVRWIDFTPNPPPPHHCRTTASISPGNLPRASIQITKPDPAKPWTGETVQRLLGTLLHELAHAFLLCCPCTCADCRCPVTASRTVGLTGHGPAWVRLCEAVEAEAEAEAALRGLPGRWDLGCGEHGVCVGRERRARERFEENPLARLELQRRGERLSG